MVIIIGLFYKDFVKEVLEFHSTPINNITTNLYYEK